MNTAEYEITERPITGDVNTGDVNTTPQITKGEFLQLVDNVLNLPHVKALVWEQYTPYFNDGEPCTFNVYEGRIILDLTTDEEKEYSDYGDGSLSTYDLYEGELKWIGTYGVDRRPDLDNSPKATFEVSGVDTRAHYLALTEFNDSARWERVAQLSFGDHAEVTATKEGFNVEYYEHD